MAAYNAERKAGQITFVLASGTFSPATNCGAGNTLVLVAVTTSGSAQKLTAVTDTKGNTWTVDKTAGTGPAVSICSTKQNAGALTTGDTVTMTGTGSGVVMQIWCEEFTGQYDFDVAASATGTTGAGNTGTTAATASTDEFAVAGICATKSGAGAVWTWTKDANYTNFTTAPPLPNASGSGSSAAHYRLLAATGTQLCTDTVNQTTNSWAGAIATYKVAAAAAHSLLFPMRSTRDPLLRR